MSLSKCNVHEGRVLFRDKLLVPDNEVLRYELIKEVHESPKGGYRGTAYTTHLINRQYV
jgi:hypothetical protein